jgi:hypothetical protein
MFRAADVAVMEMTDDETFPPCGWVTSREAARRLGVAVESLTCSGWAWRSLLRGTGRCVRRPEGGRCGIYPVAVIERIEEARAAAEAGPVIPEGFVDRDGACRMFGVTRHVWKRWVREGKAPDGRLVACRVGGKKKLYAVEDLARMRDEMFGEEKLYKDAHNHYHVPAEFVRREEAWARLGVGKPTWERWEREGKITCGVRVPGGPKLYKVEDVGRLLDEYGRYSPPYPDPERAGVYRVPLSGRDIKRREALVDADVLSLIEGRSCSWSTGDGAGFVTLSRGGVNGVSGVPLRRVIMGVSGSESNVRHVNGDPLDCRRANLVVRTVRQRCRNARKAAAIKGRSPSSRFKGVHFEWQTKRWRARIRVDGKDYQLGRFGDELAAAVAYDEAAREWFGGDARLNFPEGVDAWLEREGFAAAGREAA